MKVGVYKLNINKLVKVLTSWNDLKVEDLDASKLKNVPVDLKAVKLCSR